MKNCERCGAPPSPRRLLCGYHDCPSLDDSNASTCGPDASSSLTADAFARQESKNLDGSVRREAMLGGIPAGFEGEFLNYIEANKANPKDIAGSSKPRMGLIPVGAMEPTARVMELGAKKYGPYNWRQTPIKNMVYAHAALRHLNAWIGGQTVDPESGQSHLAHVASCMMIVLDAEASGTCIEDRVWLSCAAQKESQS